MQIVEYTAPIVMTFGHKFVIDLQTEYETQSE